MALMNWLVNFAHTILLEHSFNRGSGGSPCEKADGTVGNGRDEMKREKGLDEGFRVPLHYPRYKKVEYEKMEEWKVDMLLHEYGLKFDGSLEEKRRFAMGSFLWPDQF